MTPDTSIQSVNSIYQAANIHFSPIVPAEWLWLIGIAGIALIIFSFLSGRKRLILRLCMFTVFLLALLNPSLVQEERNFTKDVATIVVDRSFSQNFGDRQTKTDKALASMKKAIEESGLFELRIIEAPRDGKMSPRTDLFSALDQNLGDIPQKRRAGVIFLSDGQIHDVPQNENMFDNYGPVSLAITGDKNEKDRRIILTRAPAYGLVGKDVIIHFRVDDTKSINEKTAIVTLTLHDGKKQAQNVEVGKEYSFNVPLTHPSQNIFTLDVNPVKNELTYTNNKTVVIINGVRDRLKVLLVSGIPHTGERTWRDLLTSDPGVDLVHFTILREPSKFDYTPKNELSLIAFPFRELFEIKLYDFDLIIFDRYRVNDILPMQYFDNIARYVREGGAFLAASGPSYSTDQSIYDTPLGSILPAAPTGKVFEQRYIPSLTDTGKNHPVTEGLDLKSGNPDKPWGAWLRYVDINPRRGDILMNSIENKPLLVLDRIGKGRVAQLSSDHIWLWSRGYDGGGPHSELLRRIVHWLMKEPELDERALNVETYKDSIKISKRSFNKNTETIAVTYPDGNMSTIELTENKNGLLSHEMNIDMQGIYAFEDVNGTRKYAIVGNIDAPELRDVISTNKHMNKIIESSDGTSIWLSEVAEPKLRFLQDARSYGGQDWIGLKQNRDYTVIGTKNRPLLPEWLVLVILLSGLIGMWWIEGRKP